MALYPPAAPVPTSVNAPAPLLRPIAGSRTITPGPAPLVPYSPVFQDPGYVAARAAAMAAQQQANDQLRAARSRALIDFGDPSLLSGLGFAVDPNTAAAAKANQYSFIAQLHRAEQTRRRGILNSLAARGILNSGETGYQQGQEGIWEGQQMYNAEQALLDRLNSYLNNYLNANNAAQSGVSQALQNAYQNYINHPELFTSPFRQEKPLG